MAYREAAPSEDVSHLIFSFWEFTTAAEDFGAIQHEIFPDACLSLFYHRNDKFNLRRLAFNSLNLETVSVPVFPGDTFWAMRISPAACAGILGEDPADFRNSKLTEAEKFPHLTGGLLEKLNLCESFTEAIGVYENHLRKLNFGPAFGDAKVLKALKIIEETGGEIKIAALAAQLNLSPRQLERR